MGRDDGFGLDLNNRQNPGNADKMGISGVDLCPLALKWL